MLLSFVILSLAALTAFTSNRAQPDNRAKVLAQQVLKKMGGQQGWDNTRFLAWTFNDQYQVWDKHQNKYRWEKDSIVAILNTQTKDGKVYIEGKELQNRQEKQKILEKAYALWINNSYWLVMPFKLLDSGVNLKYEGEGKTLDGSDAYLLEMTFEKVGLTPQNKYHLWIDKDKGLITQWAFFKNYSDAEPTFTRRWSGYKDYGDIKLASDRSNMQSDFRIENIAVPADVPASVFNCPLPIQKL